MGIQCNIILSYYTEIWTEEKEIAKYLKRDSLDESEFEAAGNRAWGAADNTCFIICMKDWYEPECEKFIDFLKTIHWFNSSSVQIYYCPATFDNSVKFKLVTLL